MGALVLDERALPAHTWSMKTIEASEIEQELLRWERDTNHLRNGKKFKLDARMAGIIIAKYLAKRSDV